MTDDTDGHLLARLDPLPLLPSRLQTPVARVVWLCLLPAYLAGLGLGLVGRILGVEQYVEPVAARLIVPSFYLYERYWAP